MLHPLQLHQYQYSVRTEADFERRISRPTHGGPVREIFEVDLKVLRFHGYRFRNGIGYQTPNIQEEGRGGGAEPSPTSSGDIMAENNRDLFLEVSLARISSKPWTVMNIRV